MQLVKRCFELAPKQDLRLVPWSTRGIYVLYRRRRARVKGQPNKVVFDVVYIGLAGGERGVHGRLQGHRRTKGEDWTHFSVFEVWDNIRNDEIRELEGLLRHIYRFDTHANRLNLAKSYTVLSSVRKKAAREDPPWMGEAETALPRKPRRNTAAKRTSRAR